MVQERDACFCGDIEEVGALPVACQEVEERVGMEGTDHVIVLAIFERHRVDRRRLLVETNSRCEYSACRLASFSDDTCPTFSVMDEPRLG